MAYYVEQENMLTENRLAILVDNKQQLGAEKNVDTRLHPDSIASVRNLNRAWHINLMHFLNAGLFVSCSTRSIRLDMGARPCVDFSYFHSAIYMLCSPS